MSLDTCEKGALSPNPQTKNQVPGCKNTKMTELRRVSARDTECLLPQIDAKYAGVAAL